MSRIRRKSIENRTRNTEVSETLTKEGNWGKREVILSWILGAEVPLLISTPEIHKSNPRKVAATLYKNQRFSSKKRNVYENSM